MKKDNIFLSHILDSIKSILEYTDSLSFETYQKDKKTREAVERNLEIIGEASKNLSNEITENSKIPWKQIAGTRDKLIHHYFGVDDEEIWKIIIEDIPLLKVEVERLLK